MFKNLLFPRGNSCSPSLSSPPLSFSFSLYASLSFLSLLLFFSLSLFFIPPTPQPLNRPYIHPMPLYLFSLSCSSPLFLFFTSSPLHRPYIQPMNLYLFSLPRSSSPSIFNLNLRSYGQLFVLVFWIRQYPYKSQLFCLMIY